MSNGQLHTTTSYAELHGLTVSNVRYHCANDNIECILVAGAGQGVYLIPDGAVIKKKKCGRPKGWRKKNSGER